MPFTCRGAGQRMDHFASLPEDMARIKHLAKRSGKKTEVQVLYFNSQEQDERE